MIHGMPCTYVFCNAYPYKLRLRTNQRFQDQYSHESKICKYIGHVSPLYKFFLDLCEVWSGLSKSSIQYIPRNMHTVFALLCFVVVIHWLIFPYPPGLVYWHYGNLTIAPVPAKQPWWIWINTSCEFIMNDCITTTKQSTTKPCAYFLGYTVCQVWSGLSKSSTVPSLLALIHQQTCIHYHWVQCGLTLWLVWLKKIHDYVIKWPIGRGIHRKTWKHDYGFSIEAWAKWSMFWRCV